MVEINGTFYADPNWSTKATMTLQFNPTFLGETNNIKRRMYEVLDYILYGQITTLWPICAPEKTTQYEEKIHKEKE